MAVQHAYTSSVEPVVSTYNLVTSHVRHWGIRKRTYTENNPQELTWKYSRQVILAHSRPDNALLKY